MYKEFEEFAQGENWPGFNSLKGLTDAVVDAHEDLAVVGEDDWRVELRDRSGESLPEEQLCARELRCGQAPSWISRAPPSL